MNKILLIDGNSIMNRAYYGLGGKTMLVTKEGIYTNAIFGFLNTLDKFITSEEPTHICVAFDLKGKTFRHEMFNEYKAGRHAMPDELKMQFPLIKEVLDYMNISTIELLGQEADDLIGTIKRVFEENNISVTVLTGDKDMIQLASDLTTIKIPTTKAGKNVLNEYTKKSLLEDMSITSSEFIHVKALMGDKSDNIPGVSGVGEKTALKLICEYKSIEKLYENIDDIKSVKLKEKLLTDKENAFLSYKLSKINLHSPIKINVDNYKKEEYNQELLYTLFSKLEFNYFIKKYNLTNRPQTKITFDFIDDSIIQKTEEIYLYFDKKILFYTYDGKRVYKTCDISEIKKIMSNIKIINGFYLKEFLVYLFNNSIRIPKIGIDIATIEYLIDSTKSKYNLDEIFNKYLNSTVDEQYSEVIKIYSLKEGMLDLIKEEKMENLLKSIEIPLIEVLACLEHIGITVDKEFLLQFSEKLIVRISQLEKEIFLLAGSDFNLNSPKQLGKVLFEDLKLPYGKKNKTGYSTSINILEKLSKEYYIVELVIEYRKLAKLKSTYTEGLIKTINIEDNKIHSCFNQTVTATGRISSTEPNLQNLPIRTKLGREIRKAFICENSNFVLISADYSQIELRILAHLSEDDKLINSFNNNEDIHTKTASNVFGVDERMVTKEMRRAAKAVNFGIIYGISDFGLSRDLKIPVKTAKQYIEQYLLQYKNVKKYMDNIILTAQKNGYVTTIYNRKRIINELTSSNYMQREFGKRIALNTPIQGSAADIIKLAMNKVYKRLKENNMKSRLVLQIHDELVIETHKDEIELVKEILIDCMKNPFNLKVSLEININIGNTLFEMK